jgi:methyl-accepting chemotaxis protein
VIGDRGDRFSVHFRSWSPRVHGLISDLPLQYLLALSDRRIGEMIKAVQDYTTAASSEVTQGTGGYQVRLERANQTREELGMGLRVVEQVQAQAGQIASATNQQSLATEQISSDIEAVATIARRTAAGAVTAAQATEDMARLAQELNRTRGRLKMRHGH